MRHRASRLIEFTQRGDDQPHRQLGRARVVNADGIADSDLRRYVGERGVETGGEELHDLQSRHLPGQGDVLRISEVVRHEEPDPFEHAGITRTGTPIRDDALVHRSELLGHERQQRVQWAIRQ